MIFRLRRNKARQKTEDDTGKKEDQQLSSRNFLGRKMTTERSFDRVKYFQIIFNMIFVITVYNLYLIYINNL